MENADPNAVAAAAAAIAFGLMLLAVLISTLLTVLIFCMVFSKAGYSWALGLLMLVPIANIIMPFVLAFGDWPVRRELRLLKQQLSAPPASGQ